MRERVQWVDTAKFFGIFAIYLGHFGYAAGKSYSFVFSYHVAFFFLLSGCMSNYDKETNLGRFFVKKIKSIMIPFWMFSVVSIVIHVIQNDSGLKSIKDMLIVVAKGNIRNSFVASALWFLSCLFLMEIIFKLLKYLQNKWLICLICLCMYVIAEKVITPRPISQPHWLYNLDSVFYYIIYYAIGYLIYPFVLELFELDTRLKRNIFLFSGGAAFVISAFYFMGKDCLGSVFGMLPFSSLFLPILKALVMIWVNLIAAKMVEKVALFNEMGSQTLFLCGNEYVVKTLLTCFVGLFGIEIALNSPLYVYLYTTLVLIVCTRLVIPFEKKVIASVKETFRRDHYGKKRSVIRDSAAAEVRSVSKDAEDV